MSLKNIEKAVNGILPGYTSLKVVPRSVPVYIDKILKGEVRFSKKIGNNIAAIDPDITTTLSEDVKVKQDSFTVEKLQTWFIPDAVVSFKPDIEFNIINDVSYTDNIVLLKNKASVFHEEGSYLTLYAVPITVRSNVTENTTNLLVVASDYFILRGDQLAIELLDGLLGSMVIYDIVQATYDSGSTNYILTLDKYINRDLSVGDKIYLRTYPAYSSNIIIIPTGITSVNRAGPFLIDYLSGRLSEGDEVDEFLSIQMFDQQDNAVYGTLSTPSVANKNQVISSIDMRSDVILFWELVEGSFQYKKDGTSLLVANDYGRFLCYKELIPVLSAGQEWDILVSSNRNVTLRFKFCSELDSTITFSNTYLISFTYNTHTGIIQYNNSVDLSEVSAGQVFIDSIGNEYTIFAVGTDSLTLDAGLNVSTLFPFKTFHGSVRTGNAVRSFNLQSDVAQKIIIGLNSSENSSNRIEISYSPSFVFRNENLISFTYDYTTGIIQYASTIDLSEVLVNYKFLDSSYEEYLILDVNDSANRIQIASNLSNVGVISPVRAEQGAIIYNYENVMVEIKDWYVAYTPTYVFRNTSLVSFVYDSLLNKITYSSSVDLSQVITGCKFIDNSNNTFVITSIDITTNSLIITVPTGKTVDATTEQAEFRQGSIITDSVNTLPFSIAYNIMARTGNNWQATGLMIKNMFLSMEDLQSRYDAYSKANGGVIYS